MNRIIISLVVLTTVAVASAGYADERDADARAAFARGAEAYRNVNFSEALLHFEEAYRLRPSYKIQYNIAQTQLELSRPHLALEAFERYLAEGMGQIAAARRNEVIVEIRKLRQVVGEIVVTGKTGTECRIDDEHVGFLPMDQPIRLETGRHEITLHLHGEVICQKTVKIVAGKKRIEPCRAQDDADAGPEPESAWDVMSDTTLRDYDMSLTAGQSTSSDESRFIKVAPWVMSGLAVGTLAVGTVFAAKTSTLNSELNGACPSGACPAQREDDMKRLPKMAVVADMMFVASSLFTAAAIALFVVKKKRFGEKAAAPTPLTPRRRIEEEMSLRLPAVDKGKL